MSPENFTEKFYPEKFGTKIFPPKKFDVSHVITISVPKTHSNLKNNVIGNRVGWSAYL